ncbi:MAG: 50S ribosome-binding GTPase [Pseudobutyrivibrio sp.]|uniref:GTPase n=1 Tax=Pseudobutyrivibrio sp. TaxID=2014367 RepID=UPI0025F729A1|nr:GTPase [Pseudobutyrivibrio sp.]MBQ6464607.1 50S ribosome-binding GTPase [Pseudobutyrivibrio sp.]
MSEQYGNVLVLGNSGVGKSALINALTGTTSALTVKDYTGTTKEITIYTANDIELRFVDTPGFEPSILRQNKIIHDVQKWSKASINNEDHAIHMIWFCLDATASEFFDSTIKNLIKASKVWSSVPIIVVITNSYSEPERQENIEKVRHIFEPQKKVSGNLMDIIPVLSNPYVIGEDVFVAPFGLTKLIDRTNSLLPDGKQAAQTDMKKYKIMRRRIMSQSVIGTASTAGIVMGALPNIPFTDAVWLAQTELAEVKAIASIYGIKKDDNSKEFINKIIEMGTVSTAAKGVLSSIKVIPGINVAGSVINGVVSGCFVAAIGEVSTYAFEQIYLGKKSIGDIDWIKKLTEAALSGNLTDLISNVLDQVTDGTSKEQIAKIIKGSIPKAKGL